MGRWGGVGAEDGQLGEGSGVLRACYLIPHRQDVASNSALRDSGKVSRKPRRKRSSPFLRPPSGLTTAFGLYDRLRASL